MLVKISVQRSSKWVSDQRLARGENVAHNVYVPVDLSQLSLNARKVLLEAKGGVFTDVDKFTFSSDYRWSPHTSFGSDYPMVDFDAPTVEQVDSALLAMDARLTEKRDKHEADKAEAEARRTAQKAKAEEAARKMAEARELLKDELGKLATLKAERALLADYINHFPDDAKRGALKAMAADAQGATVESLRKLIEDASPVYLFNTLASDDDDE